MLTYGCKSIFFSPRCLSVSYGTRTLIYWVKVLHRFDPSTTPTSSMRGLSRSIHLIFSSLWKMSQRCDVVTPNLHSYLHTFFSFSPQLPNDTVYLDLQTQNPVRLSMLPYLHCIPAIPACSLFFCLYPKVKTFLFMWSHTPCSCLFHHCPPSLPN